ncbi:hypothetical protein P3T18_005792 [Paraburkholderia sp. GAS199]|uniref:hypothetical protein n=1 Tax=Paraburkholderia sp. GAS199 TaxID=3035126 RepID=UPI003D1CD37B
MTIRSSAFVVVGIVLGASAFAAHAETSPASAADDTLALFGATRLSVTQDIGGNVKVGATPLTSAAAVGSDALRNVSGNVGVNLAAGALNAQTNDIALNQAAQVSIATEQRVHVVATQASGNATATLGAGALSGASGNVGVNIAAGVGNAQLNALAIH